MDTFETLERDLLTIMESVNEWGKTTGRYADAVNEQVGKLWADQAELRDELHAVANRLENLTRAVAIRPGSDFGRSGDDFSAADEAAAIVNDANRSTLREVRDDG